MSETILIVDDNDIVRKLVCAYVESAGYHVIGAASPAEALDRAGASGAIDVVVPDIVMPDGGGVALVQSLRRLYPSLRALYMSGYADARLAESFIAKPFAPAELLNALRLLLDREPLAVTGPLAAR